MRLRQAGRLSNSNGHERDPKAPAGAEEPPEEKRPALLEAGDSGVAGQQREETVARTQRDAGEEMTAEASSSETGSKL